jgi:type I restriction enzyme S subunit
VVPSKSLFLESKKRASVDDPQLSATQAYGVIRQAEFEKLVGRQVTHSFLHQDKRKYVELDDFIVSMRSFQGGLERAWSTGGIRSSYVVLRPTLRVYPPFFAHLFKSNAYIQALQATSNFIRDGQDLNFNNFVLVNLPKVPFGEQKAIADFLDKKTAAIDALIEKKQKLLTLLAEKRAALVHEAIQKPECERQRLDTVSDQIRRPVRRISGREYVPIGLYNRGRGLFHKERTPANELGDSDFFWLEPGDLILSGQFAWEGAVALVGEEDSGCIATHRFPILKGCPGRLNTAYLLAFLMTKTGNFLLNENSRGAAGRNRPLNVGLLRKEKIPVPTLEEQERVAELVFQERRLQRSVSAYCLRLQEYRQALITAAVTGQLDIGEAA